jgi:catechol 2,3-dioxygenase-like lactoylglutathione lyase family enzyme
MFKVTKVDHIGIAVKNLDEAVKLYEKVLGLSVHGIETSAKKKKVRRLYPCGETELELMESTSPTLNRQFIAKTAWVFSNSVWALKTSKPPWRI